MITDFAKHCFYCISFYLQSWGLHYRNKGSTDRNLFTPISTWNNSYLFQNKKPPGPNFLFVSTASLHTPTTASEPPYHWVILSSLFSHKMSFACSIYRVRRESDILVPQTNCSWTSRRTCSDLVIGRWCKKPSSASLNVSISISTSKERLSEISTSQEEDQPANSSQSNPPNLSTFQKLALKSLLHVPSLLS